MLTFGATEGYTGGTVIQSGTLRLGVGGNLLASGAVALSGSTLDLAGQNQVLNALTATGGAITLGAGTLTLGSGSTVASTISGSGGLTTTGSGTLTLSTADTYGGTTTINGASLRLPVPEAPVPAA